MRENDPVNQLVDVQFVNCYEWTMNIINQYLLKIKNFQIRQCIYSAQLELDMIYVMSHLIMKNFNILQWTYSLLGN
jgi:hypothetical protein